MADEAGKQAGISEAPPAQLIGVLALQGAFREHVECLNLLGAGGREVRTAEQLQDIDGLIIPGGESTTMAKVARRSDMVPCM